MCGLCIAAIAGLLNLFHYISELREIINGTYHGDHPSNRLAVE